MVVSARTAPADRDRDLLAGLGVRDRRLLGHPLDLVEQVRADLPVRALEQHSDDDAACSSSPDRSRTPARASVGLESTVIAEPSQATCIFSGVISASCVPTEHSQLVGAEEMSP
jgi:hypothetical protein